MSEENFSERDFEKTVRRKTLKSFAWFFLFICFTLFAWKWLHRQPQDAGALKPLRAAMNTNEKIFSKVGDQVTLGYLLVQLKEHK